MTGACLCFFSSYFDGFFLFLLNFVFAEFCSSTIRLISRSVDRPQSSLIPFLQKKKKTCKTCKSLDHRSHSNDMTRTSSLVVPRHVFSLISSVSSPVSFCFIVSCRRFSFQSLLFCYRLTG